MNKPPKTANGKMVNCHGKKAPILTVIAAAFFVAVGFVVEVDVESEVGSAPSAEAIEDVSAPGRVMQISMRRSPIAGPS